MTAPALQETTILEVLRQVADPELDCNIVELGLVHAIRIDGARVSVDLHTTTPGCPMQDALAAGVEGALLGLEEIEAVLVTIVTDPPWSQDRMSPELRRRLGVSPPDQGEPAMTV